MGSLHEMKSTHLFALVIGRPGAFRGDFQYDDVSTILENPHLDRWDIFVGIQGPLSRAAPPSHAKNRMCPSLFSIHREDHTKPGFPTQHQIISRGALLEGERFDHGTNPREGTKVERVLRILSRP